MTDNAESLLIPTTYSRIMARVLGLHERNLFRLLQGTGLADNVLLPGDDTHINVRQQMRIIENAQGIMGDEIFGLKFGSQLLPSSHGPLGYLVLSSPDLKTALESFADYLPLRLPFSKVKISSDSRWLTCSLELLIEPTVEVTRFLQECFGLIIQAVVEAVLGEPLTCGQIGLAHDQPDYYDRYGDFLHSPVTFGQPVNLYQIPRALIHAPNVSGDSDSHAMAQVQCQNLLSQIPVNRISCIDQVRLLLLSNPMGSLKETDVAGAMFISKRTLARRLSREGTSYREITEKLLSELAVRHLRDGNLSIDSIALMLGYSDAAAFRKAFHRWYGCSPSVYRQEGLIGHSVESPVPG